MNVNCLNRQEQLFETRILKRMAVPIFLAPEKLPEFQQFPLLLYGDWHAGGFVNGIKWLRATVFKLNLPCLILPPFEPCAFAELLGLKITLNLKGMNANQLETDDQEISFHCGRREFQIQADTRFAGPGGKTLLSTTAEKTPVIVSIRPQNTATPLLLCGARLLSSSGLSDNTHRKALFNGIMAWANARPRISADVKSKELRNVEKHAIAQETLHLISVIIAGIENVNPQEITALASAVFGIRLTTEEISAGIRFLVQKGLLAKQAERLSVCQKPLERFVQEIGLWSYVRILKKEFRR